MIFTKRKYTPVDLVRLLFRFAPVHTVILMCRDVIGAFMPTFRVIVTAGFIDTSVSIAKGETELSKVYIYVILIIAVIVYEKLIGVAMSFVNVTLENRLRLNARTEMINRRAYLDYKHIENQETQDLINRVTGNINGKIQEMFGNTMGIVTIILHIAGFIGILLAYAWWVVIILVVCCVPLFIVGYRAGKKTYEAERETTKLDRAAGNFSGMLSSRDNIEERYIYGYERFINDKYTAAFEKGRIHRKNVDKKNFIAMKTGSIILIIATMIMAVPLIYATIYGNMTIGIFTTLIPAFNSLASAISWQLTYALMNHKRNLEFLKDLTAFMELSDDPSANDMPSSPPVEFCSLEFRGVSFRYPGTEPYILKDMSFRIEKGRHYAVVGVNGAGKTTLTKLITGLYREFEGEILINDKNIADYSVADLKSLCAVVYQDFAKYNLTFAENIALGDIGAFESERDVLLNSENELNFNDHIEDTQIGQKLKRTVELFDMTKVVDNMAKKYDANLGKIKDDGVDLSGGEWQRVAMARAFISPANLKILDEPTAALDPISESNVYTEFEKITGGDTTIFISHRLGSIKLADTILVVGDGKITEQGSHNELMNLGGSYAEMFNAQAEWYQIDNAEVTA